MSSSVQAASVLIDALTFHGVRHVVISPGSRSAPLAYALAAYEEAGRLEVHVRVDERVAAFTALGLAQDEPAAVVTTSGTAAANLHPALLEARHGRQGLVAITADRPHELREVGASQTTTQAGIYGHAIPYVDVPAGAADNDISNHIARYLARATGAFGPPHPVHINIGFRDPLTPTGPPPVLVGQHPRVQPRTLSGTPKEMDLRARTVVVAGAGAGPEAAEFAERGGVPLLAEPSSGARGGATAIGPYQHLLTELAPKVENVIVWGRPTLSRPVTHLLANAPRVHVVANDPGWVDTHGNAEEIIAAPTLGQPADPNWLKEWHEAELAVTSSEELAPHVLRHVLGSGHGQIMLGSSMTIRYADIHGPTGAQFTSAKVYASRGLAGIDGTISTASGIALASGPTRVVLGDLSFAHDVGALALGPRERSPHVQIVVLNDGGGAIFGRLEHGQPRYADTFDRFFATPVSVNMEEIAHAYGYDYVTITDPNEISGVLTPKIRGQSIVHVELPRLTGNF